MKKLLSIIIGLLIIAPLTFAYYETTERVTVLSLNTTTRNVVVERGDETWLLRYSGTCDQMTVGSSVILAIRSELDGYDDYLKTSDYYKCGIEQAEEITGTLRVDYVLKNKKQAGVTDKNGEQNIIIFKSKCSKILGYMYKDIYYKGYQSSLSNGDYLYLPRNEGRCSLLYVSHVEKDIDTEDEIIDITEDKIEPSTVSELNAIPGDGKVYLNWKKASDNVAVDHYIVSYSEYSLETEYYNVTDLPNKTIVNGDNYVATGLRNENRYYFYVLAVDANGNTSSRWSEEASAEPKSAIHEINRDPIRAKTEIVKVQETPLSYLFKWERIPLYKRQTIIFEADRDREFAFTSWNKSYIRILKKDSRRGKSLKLIVREYDLYGGMFMDEFEFEF